MMMDNNTEYATNFSGNIPFGHQHLHDSLQTYVHPVIYAVGVPGNILSLGIWLQPHMRNSSGIFFAMLAFSDTLVLLLHLIQTLQEVLSTPILCSVITCQLFHALFTATECLSIICLLAMAVGRCLVVIHPIKGNYYFTIARTLKIIIIMTIICLAVGIIESRFWTYQPQSQICVLEITGEAMTPKIRLMEIWNTFVITLLVILPCIIILIINCWVGHYLSHARRIRRRMSTGQNMNDTDLTWISICLSGYMVLSECPETILYLLQPFFQVSNRMYARRNLDKHYALHHNYAITSVIVESFSLTNYAVNIFIFSLLGEKFRTSLASVLKLFYQSCRKLYIRMMCQTTSLPDDISQHTTVVQAQYV